jgi:hypothetical protein
MTGRFAPELVVRSTARFSNRFPWNRLDDDDSPLLLALVRFGQKAQAMDIVQKRGLSNGARVVDRLNRFEPDFDARRCRERL